MDQQQKPSLLSLPNEVLLKIVKNLKSVCDLESLAMTCQHLSNITHDRELKDRKEIDNAEDLTCKLIEKYVKPDTKELCLNFGSRGKFREFVANMFDLVDPSTRGPYSCHLQKWSRGNLSQQILNDLQEFVPGLEELVLVGCYIPNEINVTCFPKTIRKLSLVECTLDDDYKLIKWIPSENVSGGFLTRLVNMWSTSMPNLDEVKFVQCRDDDGMSYASNVGKQISRWTNIYPNVWQWIGDTKELSWRFKMIRGVTVSTGLMKDKQKRELAQTVTVRRYLGGLLVAQEPVSDDLLPSNFRKKWNYGMRVLKTFMNIYMLVSLFCRMLWLY